MTKELEIWRGSAVMFHLYGHVEVSLDGETHSLGGERERALAARLLLADGKPVSRDALLDYLWDELPKSAVNLFHRAMTLLRQNLTSLGLGAALVNRDGVCQLKVPAEAVDSRQLKKLLNEAKTLDERTAADLLREHLARCGGEPLSGLGDHRLDPDRQSLSELRRRAELMLFRTDTRLGRAEHHIPDLIRLFEEKPIDTQIASLTMYALHTMGRQQDALTTFDRYQKSRQEDGLDVPQKMLDLQTRILRDDKDFVPEPKDFPFTDSDPDVGEKPDATERPDETEQDRTAPAPQVVNNVSGSITGDYILFGVDNRRSR
ncbi:bacterial transcriptional activator domain-containing protein [Amycolatopsis sp. NPDC089917]|uniref:AfsR/SARP family transcriptional regulator n=1 Tax=Amycolatopsis sp. NPDC089917 TaxID=3155187 RepID=UPI00341336B3